MAVFPNPNFPLLANDQADVIRIYLELMRNWDREGRPSAVASRQTTGSQDDAGGAHTSGEEPDRV